MFYVFHGDDEFTRAEELARFRARIQEDGVGELNVTTYDGRSTQVSEIINACNTLPFFTDRRLIIVTDMLQQYEGRSAKRHADDAEALANYLPRLPETTRLVFVESVSLPADKGILKTLSALPNAYVREFPALNPNKRDDAARLRQWISARARTKGVDIEPAAIAKLVEAVGGDLRQMDAELEKLAGRAGYAREIRADDVLALVTPSPETRVYEMLDYLGQRRRADALKSLHSLLATDPRYADGLYPLTMIVIRLSDLLTVKDLTENRRLDADQVRKAIKVEAWRYRRLAEQANLYSMDELVRLIRQALEIDRGIKTGALDPVLSLEMLLIDATRRPAQARGTQRERYRSRIR